MPLELKLSCLYIFLALLGSGVLLIRKYELKIARTKQLFDLEFGCEIGLDINIFKKPKSLANGGPVTVLSAGLVERLQLFKHCLGPANSTRQNVEHKKVDSLVVDTRWLGHRRASPAHKIHKRHLKQFVL